MVKDDGHADYIPSPGPGPDRTEPNQPDLYFPQDSLDLDLSFNKDPKDLRDLSDRNDLELNGLEEMDLPLLSDQSPSIGEGYGPGGGVKSGPDDVEGNGLVVVLDVLSDPPPPKEIVPWREIAIIFLITICDSLVFSLIQPFIPDMCMKVFGTAEEDVGMQVGVITASFSFANFFAGFSLGYVSDRVGRKPLLLIGLFTGLVGLYLFPFSPALWVAVANRFLCGATNNNLAVGKALLGDITKGETRALAFAYQGASFSFSRSLASGISGLFTGVVIAGVPLYDSNPYLLSCTIGAGLNLAAFVITFIWLKESARPAHSSPSSSSSSSSPSELEMKSISSLDPTPSSPPSSSSSSHLVENVEDHDQEIVDLGLDGDDEFSAGNEEESTKKRKMREEDSIDLENDENEVDLKDSSLSPLVDSSSSSPYTLSSTSEFPLERPGVVTRTWRRVRDWDFSRGVSFIIHNPLLRRLQTLFLINSFCNGGIVVALTLLCSLSVEKHGLGMSPLGLGIVFGYFGGISAVIQLVFFRRLHKRFGAVRLYNSATITFAFSTLSLPLCTLYYWLFGVSMWTTVMMWGTLGVSLTGIGYAFMTGLPVLGNILSNSSDPKRQGLTMGVTQSGGAVMRTLSPLFSGFLFTLSVSLHFPFLLFIFLSSLYVICFLVNRLHSPSDLLIMSGDRPAPSS